MSIFNKKKQFSRPEFRELLRKAPSRVPDSNKVYSRQERTRMEKELFPKTRFQSHISEIEVKKRMRELRKEQYKAKSREEKLKIDRKIKFLKGTTGVKPY